MIEQGKYIEADSVVRAKQAGWVPVIDLRHCKGCGECVQACPQSVLEVRSIDPFIYERLGWFARTKIRHHGMQVATVIRIDDCQSCGECLEACREHAIRKSFSIPETGSGHQRI